MLSASGRNTELPPDPKTAAGSFHTYLGFDGDRAASLVPGVGTGGDRRRRRHQHRRHEDGQLLAVGGAHRRAQQLDFRAQLFLGVLEVDRHEGRDPLAPDLLSRGSGRARGGKRSGLQIFRYCCSTRQERKHEIIRQNMYARELWFSVQRDKIAPRAAPPLHGAHHQCTKNRVYQRW